MSIKEYRIKAELRQEDIAQRLNVDRSTVTKRETGVSTPTVDKLIAMSKIIGCTVDELLGVSDEK